VTLRRILTRKVHRLYITVEFDDECTRKEALRRTKDGLTELSFATGKVRTVFSLSARREPFEPVAKPKAAPKKRPATLKSWFKELVS
jgi:hypothetical protein